MHRISVALWDNERKTILQKMYIDGKEKNERFLNDLLGRWWLPVAFTLSPRCQYEYNLFILHDRKAESNASLSVAELPEICLVLPSSIDRHIFRMNIGHSQFMHIELLTASFQSSWLLPNRKGIRLYTGPFGTWINTYSYKTYYIRVCIRHAHCSMNRTSCTHFINENKFIS